MQDYELVVVGAADRVETSVILASDDQVATEIALAFEPSRFWELHHNGRHVADWLGGAQPARVHAEPKSWAAVDPGRIVLLG